MPKLIPLTRGQFAIVDDADFDWLMRYSWRCLEMDKGGYAATDTSVNGVRRCVAMHRLIMNAPAHLQVDHIDRNSLNNTRANLRFATREENARNRRPRKIDNKASLYKGVYRKTRRLWCAELKVNGRRFGSYGFTSEVEAAKAYDHLAKTHFGEFAYLNFPEPQGEQQAEAA